MVTSNKRYWVISAKRQRSHPKCDNPTESRLTSEYSRPLVVGVRWFDPRAPRHRLKASTECVHAFTPSTLWPRLECCTSRTDLQAACRWDFCAYATGRRPPGIVQPPPGCRLPSQSGLFHPAGSNADLRGSDPTRRRPLAARCASAGKLPKCPTANCCGQPSNPGWLV